jgi:hypothetical protein
MLPTQEIVPVANITGTIAPLVTSAIGMFALGKTASGVLKIVHEGDMGIVMSSGIPHLKEQYKNLSQKDLDSLYADEETDGIYDIRGPGRVWLRPFVDKVVIVNCRDRVAHVDPYEIEARDGQMVIKPAFCWYVRPDGDNPYKAWFNVYNEKDNEDERKIFELEQRLSGICVRGLEHVLRGKSREELININHIEASELTIENTQQELLDYGVTLKDVMLKPFSRSYPQVTSDGFRHSRDPLAAAQYIGAIDAGEKSLGADVDQEPDRTVVPIRQ